MGAQAQCRVGGDGLDAARVGVEAGGLAADAAEGVRAGELGVALRGQAGVLAAEQADAGGGHEGRGGGGVQVQQRFGEALDGVAQGAAVGFPGFVALHGAAVLALGLRVHGVGVCLQGPLAIVAGQALCALLAGTLAQGITQLACGLELTHGFGGVHLGAVDAGALPAAGCGAHEQAFARAQGGPAFGVAIEAFAQPPLDGE